MENILVTNRLSIVKVCVVWMLGLAVLLGSVTVSSALPKGWIRIDKCMCTCQNKSDGHIDVLIWERKGNESCNIVGKDCNKGTGTIVECVHCKAYDTIKKQNRDCTAYKPLSFQPGGGVIKPPAEQGETVPSTSPLGTLGGSIYERGVEGKPAPTEPTEKEDKATTPK